LLVFGAMTLLIWGAVLDGRDQKSRLEGANEAARQDRSTRPATETLRVVDPLQVADSA